MAALTGEARKLVMMQHEMLLGIGARIEGLNGITSRAAALASAHDGSSPG